MKVNLVTPSLQHGTAQVVMQNQPRCAGPCFKRVDMAAQEVLQSLIEEKFQIQSPSPPLLFRHHLATSQNWLLYKEFVDYESGAKGDRDEFQSMLADASRRKFDVLLVWNSDRLTREGAYQTMHYLKILDGYGVRFRSYTESFLDTTGPVRDLLIAIAGWLAQQEREKIRLRTLAGQARARSQGKIIGRPKLSVDVCKLAALRSEGLSWSQIRKATGVSKGTAQRALAPLPKSVLQNANASLAESAPKIANEACP